MIAIRWLGENEAADMENGRDGAPALIDARPVDGDESDDQSGDG
jgi:hypothetical protein